MIGASTTATTVMLAPGVPVPLIVGVGSTTSRSAGTVMTGGTVIVKSTALLTTETFPAASVDVAVAVCGPSASVVASSVQAPVPLVVAVPTLSPSTSTRTVLPASAVPLIVGVVSG